MESANRSLPSFVIKAREIAALNHLQRNHPRPLALTWINRGTDQVMRPTTVSMLLRTMFSDSQSLSIAKLHDSAGLRVTFAENAHREIFASCFTRACETYRRLQRSHLTAVFDRPELAECGFRELTEAGIPRKAMSILWRAGQFVESRHDYPVGHSRLSVLGATAGGGLAGAILGISIFAIPGLGPVAIGGAILAQAIGTIGAFGGAVGATGGAIARMLSDIDVDDREVSYFEMQIRHGKVFLSIDPAEVSEKVSLVREILERNGGQFASGDDRSIKDQSLAVDARG